MISSIGRISQKRNNIPPKRCNILKRNIGELFSSICIICMDSVPSSETFKNSGCGHSFCSDCISRHVAVKIQGNISVVECPVINCKINIEPETCRGIIPKEVFDRWDIALCESLIMTFTRFYCPYKDCASMLVDDGDEFVSDAECSSCARLFCAQCKVAWHAGMDCNQFQSLNKLVRKNPFLTKKPKIPKRETGELSSSFCIICMDSVPSSKMFRNNGCGHSFCSDCISRHVDVKIQDNISMVKCPEINCKINIKPETCRGIIPKQVFDRWEIALCESLVMTFTRFYCPFKDCASMLVDDGDEFVSLVECPSCTRLFCAQCKVAWHAGMECKEFQSLNKDVRVKEDLMLLKLSKEKKWRRCPNCKFFVQKDEGCLHIACSCGYHFCYGCGSSHTDDHVCRS